MKVTITYERLEPNTTIGECLKIVQTFTSFNKKEIDDMEKIYADALKSGTVVEEVQNADSD